MATEAQRQGIGYTETEQALGYAWSALRSIADDKLAPVAVQLNAQRAMDNLRTLYPAATEGLES